MSNKRYTVNAYADQKQQLKDWLQGKSIRGAYKTPPSKGLKVHELRAYGAKRTPDQYWHNAFAEQDYRTGGYEAYDTPVRDTQKITPRKNGGALHYDRYDNQ